MSQRHAEWLGRALAGTYVIERLLGQGGMGAVYAARHARTGGIVAVKVLDTEADEELYRRFQAEARIVSALRHPHIVQVIDFDEDEDGTPFLVMELLEGEDLQKRLRRVDKLPIATALELGRQVGGALHAAHQLGVVHRDIKPQNIFLSRHQLTDEVIEVAKVVDFGISKIRDHAQQTQDRTVLGTPYYMSPEAAQAQNEEVDGRSDQWALAVILYRCISGKLPYANPDPLAVLYQVVNEKHRPLCELVPEVPRHVGDAIERAMSKHKEDRFPTMADFVRALDGTRQAVPEGARVPELSDAYDIIEVSRLTAEVSAGNRVGEAARPAPRRPGEAPLLAPVPGKDRARPRRRRILVGALLMAALGVLPVLLWPRGGGKAPVSDGRKPSLGSLGPEEPEAVLKQVAAQDSGEPAPVLGPDLDMAPALASPGVIKPGPEQGRGPGPGSGSARPAVKQKEHEEEEKDKEPRRPRKQREGVDLDKDI
jgi:serine/threonine-protein kinase